MAMPPPGGCARGGEQWAGTHGPPRLVPAYWIAKPTPQAPMVVRIVVLELPSQVPDHGIVRSQDSTERTWYKSLKVLLFVNEVFM